MSTEGPDDITRLDPDAAAPARETATEPGSAIDPGSAADPGTVADPGSATDPRTAREPEWGPAPAPPPVIDVRPYRWAVGIIGLIVIIGIGTWQFVTHGRATTGVAPGHRLHWFAAPLADTDLQGDANLRPTCSLAHHDPRALNLCIDAHRSAVVVSFFVPDSAQCVAQVDALQALSGRYPAARVQFLAVAVHSSHAVTARLVRTHHWTIPVAYDPDGAVGEQYGVVVCPMAELASRGGTVRDRLIGDRWSTSAEIGPRVSALARTAR